MHMQVQTEETIVTRFDGLAYSLFGEYFDSNSEMFGSLEHMLRQSRMPIDVDLYMSRMTLAAVFASVGGLLLFVPFIFGLAFAGLFDSALAGVIPVPFNVVAVVLLGFIMYGVMGVVGGIGTAYGLAWYRVFNRKSNLDRQAPFAVTFMYALSRGGMNFVEVLRTMAEAKDAYGDVAYEFESVIRDMEYLSIDLPRALRRASARTPSETLANFLDDTVSVIDSGADLTAFLEDKSENMLRDAEEEQENFLTILALLGEVYVTAFVAGPLFLIIITVIMTMLGSGGISLLAGIVYGLLPLMNVAFFILIDTLTEDEKKSSTRIDEGRSHASADELRERFEKYVDEDSPKESRIEQILRAKEKREESEWRRDPINWMLDNPLRTLVVTGPFTTIYLLVALLSFGPSDILLGFTQPSQAIAMGELGPVVLTTYLLVVPLVLMLAPISVFHEISSRRNNSMMNRLPDALKQLAASNAIGISLTESLAQTAQNTKGKLGTELEQVGNDITWYSDVNGALVAFSNRVRLPVVTRTVKLITEANQSTGDIADVLSVAAKDVGKRQQLRKERFNEMLMYTVVVLISFAVYLFVIYMLDTAFLSEIANLGSSGATTGSADAGNVGGQNTSGIGFDLGSLPIEMIRMIFYHSTVIQAIGSGLLAGQLGRNDVLSGLKYSVVLLIIATAVFLFI
jgi:flagellar protein FlaJ